MAVKMTRKLLSTHRFLKMCVSCHHSNINTFIKVNHIIQKRRFFSTGTMMCVDVDDPKSPISNKLTSRQTLLAKRRPLSPLERISSLLNQDSLTPEVEELRLQDKKQHEYDNPRMMDYTESDFVQEKHRHADICEDNEMEHFTLSDHVSPEVEGKITDESFTSEPLHFPCLKGETQLKFGEFLIAEYRKKGQLEFKKMFRPHLGMRLQSSWGVIPHEEIAGMSAGSFLKTNRGVSILIRRASLEDYVLFMRRGPAISYPKDAAAMLMMMDVTEGDCVLEAGSGSGAMSLFLSRAVGAGGKVVSVEVREDHLKRAVLNYNRWRTSWELRREQPWPDNVEFVQADLCNSPVLEGHGFHAVALDLIHPHLVLPIVNRYLHSGAVCAVYLANITQVVDLLEGLRCLHIPLLCERIMELPARDWIVAPALHKDGTYCLRKSPNTQENPEEKNGDFKHDRPEKDPPFGSVPYIARPHPQQLSHTAFLVKLRKHA